MPVEVDDAGNVIFLAARASGQVAAQNTSGAVAYRGAKSGNNAYDPASGRFTSKGNRKLRDNPIVNANPVTTTRSGIPQGVTQEEWQRRLDTVRQAAHDFAELDATGAQAFLKDRVTDLSKVDVQQFLTDVHHQQMDTLIDVFDANLRAKTQGVKVTAPRGWVRTVFSHLSADELTSLVTRLQGRGYSNKQLAKALGQSLKDPQLKAAVSGQLGVKLEDGEEFEGISFYDDEPPEPEPDPYLMLAEAVRDLAQRPQEAPVVHVAPAEVKVSLPQPTPKRVVRDPETNEIVGVEPVT
jgi:hypothetical protein